MFYWSSPCFTKCRIVLRLFFELEVEKWRLTRRDFLHQCSPTLSARFLKLTTFSTTKHLFFLNVFLFSWCCTNSSEKQPTDINLSPLSFVLAFFDEKFAGGATKSRQIWIVIWMQRINDSHWLRKALIGYTSTCENGCELFWLAV